jgi:hypothetical protein
MNANARQSEAGHMLEPRWGSELPLIETIGVEPVNGWWTGNTAWGKRFSGDMPDSLIPTVNPIDLVSLPAAPGPPRAIGIQLYRSDKQIQVAGNCDVQALVTYGAGGTSNTFALDWSAGAGFTLLANTVRVAIRPYRPSQNSIYSPLRGMVLGATIGLGATSNNHPVFTPIGQTAGAAAQRMLNPGFSQQYAIPDFATGLHVMCFGPGFNAFDLTHLFIEFRSTDNSTIDVLQASVVASDLYSPEGLRIPGAAQFVTFYTDILFAVPFLCQFVLGI